MFTEEEINRRFEKSNDEVENAYLLAHLFTKGILQDELKNTSEEKYFEGLIFSSYIVFLAVQQSNNYNEKERNDFQNKMIAHLWAYSFKFSELSEISNNDEFSDFVRCRYYFINHEINKMKNDQIYLFPSLINNMYVNPLNKDDMNNVDIMEKLDAEELFKLNIVFRIKYKSFMEILALTFERLKK